MSEDILSIKEIIARISSLVKAEDYPSSDKSSAYKKDHFAVLKAIEALEKQIPKEPYWRIEEDAEGYACPICEVGVTADHGRIKLSHCSNCGQALGWEIIR